MKYAGGTPAIFASLCMSVLASCSAAVPMNPAQDENSVSTPDLSAFEQAWEEYRSQHDELNLQKDCRPRRFSPPPGTPRRGAAVMFHGYGGCPQQFFALAESVAAEGIDVLLPRLPGHGYIPPSDQEDDLAALPTAADWEERYSGLARQMNRIMAHSPGAKVVVGFSLGGTMSINASLWAPGLYDRMLLVAPLLAIRGGAFVESAAVLIGKTPGIRNLKVKSRRARAECRQWAASGRDGFCDYRFKHVVAVVNLEKQNRRMYRKTPFDDPLQIIAAGDEAYVSNDEIIEFTQRQRENGPVALCFLPQDVPHEILSPFENTDREMYWLESLLEGMKGFITVGATVPIALRETATEGSRKNCRIRWP